MLVINDRLENWEINSYEKARLAEGNHRVFSATAKSYLCPKCFTIINFRIGSGLSWCINCFEEIPNGDLLLTDIGYRIKYHFGKEGKAWHVND